MVRPVAAVILGFLGMMVWVLLATEIARSLLGEDFAIDAATQRTTAAWLALGLSLSFVGAVLGGWLTASIAKAKAVPAFRALALLVLVMGLYGATAAPIPQEMSHGPGSEDATAALEKEQPTWYPYVIPFVGAAGVLIGGLIRSRAAALEQPSA